MHEFDSIRYSGLTKNGINYYYNDLSNIGHKAIIYTFLDPCVGKMVLSVYVSYPSAATYCKLFYLHMLS